MNAISNSKKGKPGILKKICTRMWKMGLFSTICALALLVIAQIIVLWTNEGSLLLALPKLGQSWMNILRNNVYTGVIALGMCLIIISGGIDLSVGSMTCAIGAILMFLLDPKVGLLASFGLTGIPAYVIAVILALAVGIGFGECNGLLVSCFDIPPFIVTLGTMKIFRSVTQQCTRHFNPTVPEGFKTIASLKVGNEVILPIIYWLVLAVIIHVLFRYTEFGKNVIAVGSNQQAARYSGINVKAVKRRVYALCGLMCAVAAVIYVARIGSMDFASAGSGYEMDSIAGVIVGGTAMTGGRGSIWGAFLGMLIIGAMNNLLNMLGMPPFLCDAVSGVIIIVAVLVQHKLRRKE